MTMDEEFLDQTYEILERWSRKDRNTMRFTYGGVTFDAHYVEPTLWLTSEHGNYRYKSGLIWEMVTLWYDTKYSDLTLQEFMDKMSHDEAKSVY